MPTCPVERGEVLQRYTRIFHRLRENASANATRVPTRSFECVDPFVATLSHAGFAANNRRRRANWTILTRSRPRPPCTCTAPWRRGKCPRTASPTPWSFSPSCCCCSLCARSRLCSRRDGTAPCPTTPPGEACSATSRILCSPRRKAARLASTARTWSSVSRAAPSFCNTVIYRVNRISEPLTHAATFHVSSLARA